MYKNTKPYKNSANVFPYMDTKIENPLVIDTVKNNEKGFAINVKTSKDETNDGDEGDDVNVLSGDNKVDVDIAPDVKSNDVYLQLCSCSMVFNCFTRNSTAKNSD